MERLFVNQIRQLNNHTTITTTICCHAMVSVCELVILVVLCQEIKHPITFKSSHVVKHFFALTGSGNSPHAMQFNNIYSCCAK